MLLDVGTDAIKFDVMIYEPEAEALRHFTLKLFKLGIGKLDNGPRLDIDQMIMMDIGNGFITRASVAKFMALQYAGLFQ